jgi:hypothetical protein
LPATVGFGVWIFAVERVYLEFVEEYGSHVHTPAAEEPLYVGGVVDAGSARLRRRAVSCDSTVAIAHRL